jgi:hypothetical protein
MKPIYGLQMAGQTWSVYIGLLALAANVAGTSLCSLIIRDTRAAIEPARLS